MQKEHNRKKTTSSRQSVSYLQAWPRIWTRDNIREQIQQVARAGLVHRMARLLVQCVDHLNSIFTIKQIFSCLEWIIIRTREQRKFWINLGRILVNLRTDFTSCSITCSESSSLLFKNLVFQPPSQQITLLSLVIVPIFWGGSSGSTVTSAMISCPLKRGSHFP